MKQNNHLLIFGFGYSAQYIAKELIPAGWRITATSRKPQEHQEIVLGVQLLAYSADAVSRVLDGITHVLISVPPEVTGCPVYAQFASLLAAHHSHIKWIGYFSTTGVYGNHQGAWVDEDSAINAQTPRAKARLIAEQQWLDLGKSIAAITAIFRLAGIYGPGRNVLQRLLENKVQNIFKPNQYFSRIHVEDIANVVIAAINNQSVSDIYNVCDDLPTPSHILTEFAAELLNMPTPSRIPLEQATLSPMAQEFYQSNRRVSNQKIKQKLDLALKYPTYKQGLLACLPEN